ncbi:MAG: hypothetical protein ACP5NL_04690 [Thermoplasmata archaeon]
MDIFRIQVLDQPVRIVRFSEHILLQSFRVIYPALSVYVFI